MYTGFRSVLYVGEKIEIVEEIISVTKYDENTGKPYKTKEKIRKWIFSDNKHPIEEDFSVHTYYYEEDSDCGIYGIKVKETPSDREDEYQIPEIITIDEIMKALDEYEKTTKRKGQILLLGNILLGNIRY